MEKTLSFLGLILWTIATFIWIGFIGHIMWGWFLTPVFGLPVPSLALVIGVSITIRYLFTNQGYKKAQKEDMVANLLWPYLFGLMALSTGWVVQLFI